MWSLISSNPLLSMSRCFRFAHPLYRVLGRLAIRLLRNLKVEQSTSWPTLGGMVLTLLKEISNIAKGTSSQNFSPSSIWFSRSNISRGRSVRGGLLEERLSVPSARAALNLVLRLTTLFGFSLLKKLGLICRPRIVKLDTVQLKPKIVRKVLKMT